MKEREEKGLFGKHKGQNVFLLVDGGTINRKRLLNASLGWSCNCPGGAAAPFPTGSAREQEHTNFATGGEVREVFGVPLTTTTV